MLQYGLAVAHRRSDRTSVDAQARKIIIRGVTNQGRKFRPSDWAERLCGAFATYGRGRRVIYHPHIKTGIWEGTNCVVVDAELEDSDPLVFDFLMRFAADNDLQLAKSATFPPSPAG
jgi:hypothetical protein